MIPLAAQGPDQKFDTGVRPLSQNNSFPSTPPPKEHTPLFGLNIDVPLNWVWFSGFNVVGVPSKWEQEEKKMVSLLLFALVSG